MQNSVNPPWWVYMVETQTGKLYTGITTDIERRFRQHCGELKGGARFFNSDAAKKIVYREGCTDRRHASQREAAIKRLHRNEKIQLIASGDD